MEVWPGSAYPLGATFDGVGHKVRTWDVDLDRREVADALARQLLLMLHPRLDARRLVPAPA